MKLAISNIAWDAVDDAAVMAVMRREQVRGVELAPTKWRDNPFEAPAADIAELRGKWNDAGFQIVSLQSLLFGRPDLQLFGDDTTRQRLADYVKRVIDFAQAVGARALVFGSPKNRTRGSLPASEAMSIAADFFAGLGDYALTRDTAICIEANPPGYGCDFITTTAESVALCRAVSHPAIAVNVDLGGMTMSGEDPTREIESAAGLIRHVHASEANLAELGAGANHARAAEGLQAIGYAGWVSIEMRAAGNGANVAAVERAITLARNAYASPRA